MSLGSPSSEWKRFKLGFNKNFIKLPLIEGILCTDSANTKNIRIIHVVKSSVVHLITLNRVKLIFMSEIGTWLHFFQIFLFSSGGTEVVQVSTQLESPTRNEAENLLFNSIHWKDLNFRIIITIVRGTFTYDGWSTYFFFKFHDPNVPIVCEKIYRFRFILFRSKLRENIVFYTWILEIYVR